ncbi:transmembrane amino acid transporter protein-domain-containing protein [Apiospora phragmitis]|uniref:Transmembrane amino acid transporter protein-domain-containing protein n=1 Tax=Apiospora phragmitis TaxID=2905665 RepID=A0ABR1VDV9_9PEZI
MTFPAPTTALALDGEDPRTDLKDVAAFSHTETPVNAKNVTLEEYLHYASITRSEEKEANARYRAAKGPHTWQNIVQDHFSRGSGGDALQNSAAGQTRPDHGAIEAEWKNASRAVRTAGWGSAFYLIATDVLGPSQTPWSFSQLGYGPGFALYTVFGVLSGCSGLILWRLFIQLDSDRYPMRNFADIFYRIFGAGMKHFVNIAQAVQLIAVLGFLILLNGQGISQMAYGPSNSYPGICFVACLVIFTVAGFAIGQIRTLQKYSWLANLAVFLNLLVVFIVMGLAANYAPNYNAVMATFGPQWEPGPIVTFAGTPPDGFATGGTGFVATVNGVNQALLCYGGAALFVFFLAEMRHPMDFWKSILCAQILIYVIYIVFGMVVYHYHGQYTYAPAVQGVSDYKWQTALNVMNLIMGLIACGLFGNIGVKIVYIEVFEKLMQFPPMHTPRGRVWWALLSPAYWVLGFILAAAIPQFPLVSGLIGAIFGVGFTYILPALAALGFRLRRDAMLEETERFDPATGAVNYVDAGIRRVAWGFMKRPVLNLALLVYFLGGLVTCGLGCYAAIIQLMGAFSSGVATSFTCDSPV